MKPPLQSRDVGLFKVMDMIDTLRFALDHADEPPCGEVLRLFRLAVTATAIKGEIDAPEIELIQLKCASCGDPCGWWRGEHGLPWVQCGKCFAKETT